MENNNHNSNLNKTIIKEATYYPAMPANLNHEEKQQLLENYIQDLRRQFNEEQQQENEVNEGEEEDLYSSTSTEETFILLPSAEEVLQNNEENNNENENENDNNNNNNNDNDNDNDNNNEQYEIPYEIYQFYKLLKHFEELNKEYDRLIAIQSTIILNEDGQLDLNRYRRTHMKLAMLKWRYLNQLDRIINEFKINKKMYMDFNQEILFLDTVTNQKKCRNKISQFKCRCRRNRYSCKEVKNWCTKFSEKLLNEIDNNFVRIVIVN